MPVYRDKKTKRFFIQFQLNGEPYKERLPDSTTRRDAEKIEVRVKSQMLLEQHGMDTQRSSVTFERFIQDVYLPFVENNHSRDSFEKAIDICKAALPFLKGKTMKQIKPADIERFKQHRAELLTQHGTPRKPATVARELSILSKIFSLAVRNELCEYNPCSRVEKPRFDNIQDRILRREDEAIFFANMHSEWARDVCRMVLHTGLRQNDLMQLTRFQIDRENRLISLIQGKTKRRVVVALNAVAMEIIERRWTYRGQLLFASPVTGLDAGSVRHAMIRACTRAGIPHITIRDLRRTFATRGLENGADAVTVADALGHTSLRMIPRYVRSLDNKRKLADSLIDSAVNLPTAKVQKLK